jgi:hypothetical protein
MPIILDGTNGAFLPTWTTGTRPASPANGEIGYNSTTAQLDQYVGGAWSSVPTGSASAATPTALGTVYGKTDSSALAFIGYNAGANTSGTGNTALGYVALQTNTTGTYNTAVGWNAGQASTGSENTFVGVQAGAATTSSNNVAIGKQALQTNTSGSLLTAVGFQALTANTTGSNNTAVGEGALTANTTGSENVAVGLRSLYTNTTASFNTACGRNALRVSNANSNTAMGYASLEAVTSGASNTAVGAEALKSMTTTNSNVAVGKSAGQSTTTGYENVFVGAGAGLINTTGYFNICIGNKAGENTGPTTGQSNTLIGNDARASSTNASTQLVVASRQSRTGIGDNTGLIDGGTGGIYQGNNSSSWSTTSDRRLKKNIVDNTEGLDIISQIRVRNFEYKTVEEVTALDELPAFTTIEKTGVQLGVIAQELEEVCADCVTTVSTGVKTVDSDNLFWHMINAIKDLKALNDTLTARIVALEAR